jgi:hypothetical protein
MGNQLQNIIGRLEGVKNSGSGYTALCPAHDDHNPSLSIGIGQNGQVLLKCFAGCDTPTIIDAIGLTMSDLFREDKAGGRGLYIPSKTPATVQHLGQSGCRLEEYCKAKNLPREFLEGLGLSQISYTGMQVVKMPYKNEEGTEISTRFRVSLNKSSDRFRWKSGSKPFPYGTWRLSEAASQNYVVIVEGESDAQTLWYNGYPSIGIPGASTWKKEWCRFFNDIDCLYLVVEPDKGGDTLLASISSSSLSKKLRIVELDGFKDMSDMYIDNPSLFKERYEAALKSSEEWSVRERRERDAAAARAYEQCKDLLRSQNLLYDFGLQLTEFGFAGDTKYAKLIYLIVTSRLTDKPISVVVKGPSSSGKSFLVEQVLRFFPEEAFYELSAMSDKSLAYSDVPLNHRMLVVYEAVGANNETGSYLLRSLLSEGCIRYEYVEKTNDGLKPRMIEREGPTGLITTTTATHLHQENETRMIEVTLSDTPEQTSKILSAHALAATGKRKSDFSTEVGRWKALHQYISASNTAVVIPFAEELSKKIDPVNVRLRRDFPAFLHLIKAHAILHQTNRKFDNSGRIVATIGDYSAVYDLVGELYANTSSARVDKSVREVVQIIAEKCHSNTTKCVFSKDIAAELGVDKSSVSRRLKRATEQGFIINEETQKGRPGKYKIGEPMPDDRDVFPSPETLARCCSVASESAGIYNPLPPLNIEIEEFVL